MTAKGITFSFPFTIFVGSVIQVWSACVAQGNRGTAKRGWKKEEGGRFSAPYSIVVFAFHGGGRGRGKAYHPAPVWYYPQDTFHAFLQGLDILATFYVSQNDKLR